MTGSAVLYAACCALRLRTCQRQVGASSAQARKPARRLSWAQLGMLSRNWRRISPAQRSSQRRRAVAAAVLWSAAVRGWVDGLVWVREVWPWRAFQVPPSASTLPLHHAARPGLPARPARTGRAQHQRRPLTVFGGAAPRRRTAPSCCCRHTEQYHCQGREQRQPQGPSGLPGRPHCCPRQVIGVSGRAVSGAARSGCPPRRVSV